MKLSRILNEDARPEDGDYIKVGDELNIIYIHRLARWAFSTGDPRPLKRRIMFVKNVEIKQYYEKEALVSNNPLDNIRDKFENSDTIKCLIRGEAIYGHLDKGGVDGQLKSGYPWREFYGEFEARTRTEIAQFAKFFWLNPKPKRGKQLYLRDAQELVGVVIEWITDRYNTNLRDFLQAN